jgi:hypothetical protein
MSPITVGHQRAFNTCMQVALAADKPVDWAIMRCAAILDLLPEKIVTLA